MTDDALVLGPLLRYVDETTAAIWVEVAERGVVTAVVGERRFEAATFTVHGHHYALVEVDGLLPGTSTTYAVWFDGVRVWPSAESPYPPSRIRTMESGRPQRLMFGSCHSSAPHDAEHNAIFGVDVLHAYALQLPHTDEREWPDLVLLLGDQVYADETSDAMRDFIAARRDIDEPPYGELKDYEEYTHLYRLAWSEPSIRWLLSTVPSAMMFDDHDIRDDWNTSQVWREQMDTVSWWRERLIGGLGSYWVYQHVGNLSPRDRSESKIWNEVCQVGREGDAGDALDDFAYRAECDPAYVRWSYHRDLGGSRIVVLDTRAARVLSHGRRKMLDDEEMAWFDSLANGGVDHLLVGTSLPFLLPVGLHHFEAWSEAVAGGAWGPRAARLGERMRQLVDLEHWAAFQESFQRVAGVVASVARGERGAAPATVSFLSGDVHHSFVAAADLEDSAQSSRVLQLVCSPIRNRLPRVLRLASAASSRGLAWPMGRIVARTAHVPDPPFRWSVTDGPWFDNVLATLELDGRRARATWHTARPVGGDGSAGHDTDPTLVTVRTVVLS